MLICNIVCFTTTRCNVQNYAQCPRRILCQWTYYQQRKIRVGLYCQGTNTSTFHVNTIHYTSLNYAGLIPGFELSGERFQPSSCYHDPWLIFGTAPWRVGGNPPTVPTVPNIKLQENARNPFSGRGCALYPTGTVYNAPGSPKPPSWWGTDWLSLCCAMQFIFQHSNPV